MINPNEFSHIVVLTGAGISAESGLKTFRDSDGLWEGHRVEDVATPEAFAKNPNTIYRFYNERREQLLGSASPNDAHRALAKFEKTFEGDFTLITQNVDNLHEQGGSLNILHMHGELLKARCRYSEKIFDCHDSFDAKNRCPCCAKTNALRPHIVWFGEIPLYMDQIESALTSCDLFISIGTSGSVYPAAGFVQLAKNSGATCVELNMEPSKGQAVFDTGLYGPATEVVTRFLFQTE